MQFAPILRNYRLFSDLDSTELAVIEEMCVRRDYRRGQVIFSEGEPVRGFFLVMSGAVKIYRIGPDGKERVLHVVEANDSFAEAALFMEQYPATAEALAPTTLLEVDRARFCNQLRRDSRLALKVIQALVGWLRQLRDALTDLTMKEVPARFATYVLSLARAGERSVAVTMTKTTLAQMLGTTKETLSRVLHRFQRQRVLSYRGHQIRIFNRARLERIAAGEEKL
ncbi:MAG: Crp/Fnr family transcriptional regulator [Verrucomicrobiae bacterium]|nr:Crp/Fnr family transcriptional regulator [Verrucomicrobiae bacterium]